jgi:hypothetical protein
MARPVTTAARRSPPAPAPAARALALALAAALGASACATDGPDAGSTRTGPWWSCPPVKGPGAEHGRACASAADCAYGHCVAGSFLVGYDPSVSICTKNNACTGPGSFESAPCSADDGDGVTYVSAFEKTKSGGNPQRTSAEPAKICARSCTSDATCAAWNPQTPHCITASTALISIGTQGVCGLDPARR